jgi:hypothetical protein
MSPEQRSKHAKALPVLIIEEIKDHQLGNGHDLKGKPAFMFDGPP